MEGDDAATVEVAGPGERARHAVDFHAPTAGRCELECVEPTRSESGCDVLVRVHCDSGRIVGSGEIAGPRCELVAGTRHRLQGHRAARRKSLRPGQWAQRPIHSDGSPGSVQGEHVPWHQAHHLPVGRIGHPAGSVGVVDGDGHWVETSPSPEFSAIRG